ncbi:hypothetical protein [Serratia fonticola]|uniref:hypothetical protein n=1 Tax=Serratia fonticola TaxID=47917 RepID=UPI0016473D48|nr:hypothetical protein [Serratia fonticola]MBC3228332.1 hypothetical protein [Serratia fonticola]
MSNPNIDLIKLARRHIKRLETISRNLTDMCIDWDGIDGGMETDFEFLAKTIEAQIKTHKEMIQGWRDEN